MKIFLPFFAIFVLAGCGGASIKKIDPAKDLDCAVIFLNIEKNTDRSNASDRERESIFVFRTWYFRQVKPDQASEAQKLVEAMKDDPKQVFPAMKECTARATKDVGFDKWASFALREFKEQPWQPGSLP